MRERACSCLRIPILPSQSWMTTSQRYSSFSGTPNVNVTKPDSPSHRYSTSSESTVTLRGRPTDEYTPTKPLPLSFIFTTQLVPSSSHLKLTIAPPELNISISPTGANLVPSEYSFTGTTVKTSYSRDFNVIGKDVSLGRYTNSPGNANQKM